MSAQQLGYMFWILGPALQLVVCVEMVRRGMRREFPFFFSYLAFHLASTVALFVVYRWAFDQYFYAYWTANVMRVLLGFAVLYELFSNALKPYQALRDLGKMLFVWAGIIMLLVAVLLAVNTSAPNEISRVVAAVLSLERSVRLMQCGMLLFLLLFGAKLSLSWRHQTFGIALGIGAYAATDLLLVSLRSSLGPGWETNFSLLRAGIYVSACAVWAVYFALPEPARIPMASSAARPILQRWNEVLAEATTGAPLHYDTPEFMPNVEATVDRVLSREGNGKNGH